MSFDVIYLVNTMISSQMSQSLWNRAMSFDGEYPRYRRTLIQSQSLWNRAMSFDYEDGAKIIFRWGLNPFGTGQCLSTYVNDTIWLIQNVSIPLEQGNVFRPRSAKMQ